VKSYPDVWSNIFHTQMCFKKILKGRIDTNIQRKKCAQCFSNSIVYPIYCHVLKYYAEF